VIRLTYLPLPLLSFFLSEAEKMARDLLEKANTIPDKISIYFVMQAQFNLQGRFEEAREVLQSGLALLDIRFPESEDELKRMCREELEQFLVKIKGRTSKELMTHFELDQDSSTLADLHHALALELLCGLWVVCTTGGDFLLASFLAVRVVSHALRGKINSFTAMAYGIFGFFIGNLKDDYSLAQEFGKASLIVGESRKNTSVLAICYAIFGLGPYAFNNHMAGR
jgi:hypothetical protein